MREAVGDVADREDGLPVLAEDVEAYVSFDVDVRVEDLRGALDLRRLVRVARGRDSHVEDEAAAAVGSLVWGDGDGKVERGRVGARGEVDADAMDGGELGHV